MSDRKGDPAKQPPECKINEATLDNFGCENIKEVGGGMSGERYRCEVCGESFFLDYDDMR